MIQVWPGGHLQRLGKDRAVIGPAFRWQEGDKVKLPHGVFTVEGHHLKLPPRAQLPVAFTKVPGKRNTHEVRKAIPGTEVAGLRLVEDGETAYLTDGLVVASRDE